MTQNKKIEFTTSVDNKGLDKLTDGLKKVKGVADDLVSTLKKIRIGGGSRDGDLAAAVKTTTNEMGKLRVESAKTADTLSDRIGKAVLRNTQHLQQQTKEFQHAARAARDLSSATRVGAMAGATAMLGATGGAGQVGSARGAGAAVGANNTPYGMSTGGGGGRGGSGGITTGMFNPYSNNPYNRFLRDRPSFEDAMGTARSTLGVASDIAGAAGKFGQYESNTAMMGLNNLARSQSYRQDLYRLSTSAPVGYGAYILNRGYSVASGNGGSSALNKTADTMADGSTRVDGTREIATGASMADYLGGKTMEGRSMSKAADISTGGIQAAANTIDVATSAAKGNFGNAVSSAKGAFGAGLDTAASIHDVNTGGLAAMGAEARSAALAAMQRIAGPQAQQMFGAIQGYAPLLAGSSRMLGGMGRQGMAMGAGSGYDVGSSAAALGQLGHQFGTREVMAGGLGQQAFAMSRKGMDAGVAGGIMGQIGMGGGDGQQVMERIFAKGIKTGMSELDMRFFEKIGTAVAENSITASGSVSGGNLPEALMFGLDKKSTMADVQGNVGGLNLINQMSTQNPFFASRSMAMAADLLGPDADGATIQALNETTPSDLMADTNEYLDPLLGKSSKQIRQKFAQQRLNMFGNVLATGDGKHSKRIQAGIAKFGDFASYLNQGGKEERTFVSAFGKATFGGANFDDFQGMMNVIGGSKEKAGKGGPSGLKDVVDGQAITNIATQTRLVFKQFENINKTLKDAQMTYSQLAKQTVDNMNKTMGVGDENYGGSDSAAAATSAAAGGLTKVAEVSEDLAQSMAKLHGVVLSATVNKQNRKASDSQQPVQVAPRTGRKGRAGSR